ncbi:hypothetical protein [Mycolicibacterium sp.]|uniref:hypothetical protein n=1 Tax=Mycolicibacterium sp. TaxID=2320850 RepID=UPI00355F944B
MSSGNQRWCGALALIIGGPIVAVGMAAPTAGADPGSEVEQAVATARGASSCGALQHNATVEQAADIVNRSTASYLDHSSGNVPADDPKPTALLRDLGIETDNAITLLGAGRNAPDAIKALLLQGYKEIPDCSYADIGTSMRVEEETGFVLVTAILVGP